MVVNSNASIVAVFKAVPLALAIVDSLSFSLSHDIRRVVDVRGSRSFAGWRHVRAAWRTDPIGYLRRWIFAILTATCIVPIVTEIAAERAACICRWSYNVAACHGWIFSGTNSVRLFCQRPRKAAQRAADGFRDLCSRVGIVRRLWHGERGASRHFRR